MAKYFLQLMKKLGFFVVFFFLPPKDFLPTEKDYEQSRALNTANFLGYCMKDVRCSKKARRDWKMYQRSFQELKTERRQSATLIVPLNLVILYKGQVMTKCIKPLRFLKDFLKALHTHYSLSYTYTHTPNFLGNMQHSDMHFKFQDHWWFCIKIL